MDTLNNLIGALKWVAGSICAVIICISIFAIIINGSEEGVGITVILFLCNMKDKYNQSIAIWIHNMIKFYQAQRFYKFVLREEDL